MEGTPETTAKLIAKLKELSERGQKFRRIVIVGHADEETDGPSVSLGKEEPKLTSTSFGTPDQPSELSKAITEVLEEDGVLVIAACGYYHWTNEWYVIRDIAEGRQPQALKAQTPEYQQAWRRNLENIAKSLRRRVAVALRDIKTVPYPPTEPAPSPFMPTNLEPEFPFMLEATPDGTIHG
jgi:hypothetical protein